MQVFATDILTYLDNGEKTERREFEVMAAFASSGDFDVRKMWPDYFPSEDVEEIEGDLPTDEETAIDFSGVKWETPADGAEQALRDLAALSAALHSGPVGVTDGPVEDGLSAFVPDPDEEWV